MWLLRLLGLLRGRVDVEKLADVQVDFGGLWMFFVKAILAFMLALLTIGLCLGFVGAVLFAMFMAAGTLGT